MERAREKGGRPRLLARILHMFMMEVEMKKVFVFIIAAALLSGLLSAQAYKGGRGRLVGVVVDKDGKPIEGVTVKFFAVKFNDGFQVLTDKDGKWVGTMLSGGQWYLDFEKAGFSPVKKAVEVKELERLPEIRIVLQKAEGLGLTDDLKKLLAEGNRFFEQKDFASALKAYSDILAKFPDAYAVWNSVANCYFNLEQYDKAEESYRKVLDKSATDVNALVGMGNCSFNRSQTAQALEWYGKVDVAKIGDPTVLFNIGLSYFNTSKLEEALKYFQRAVEVQKTFEDAYYQMGLTYVSMQKTNEAIAVFEQFLKDFPESPKADQVKGFLAYLRKK